MRTSKKNTLVFTLMEPNLLDLIQEQAHHKQCWIGRYKILKQFGGGAFAKVYECQSANDGQKYALKVYSYAKIAENYDKDSQQKMMTYINQEASLLQQCNSIHIVKCYQTIQSELFKILVLQNCKSMNLWQYLLSRGGTLDQDNAVNLISQVILGLIELHRHRIIHRDLKLQNIMVKDGICKIIDLGLSRQLRSCGSIVLGTNVGTDDMKAPEVNRNEGYGLNADLYSVGIMYLILVSKARLELRTRFNFWQKQQLFRDISEKSKDFIKQTIEVNPHKRMKQENIFKHPLFADVRNFSESQISQYLGNLEPNVNACQEVLPQRYANKSSIFVEEEKECIQITQHQLQKSYFYIEYCEEVRLHFLNCKKAEFIRFQLIANIESSNTKRLKNQSYYILLYLLSLHAYGLLSEAEDYYKINNFPEFILQVSQLYQNVAIKLHSYQQILTKSLKYVKKAFVESQIFKNYQALKVFLKFEIQKQRLEDLYQDRLRLIIDYIKKLVKENMFQQKVKIRLLAFQEVMMISLPDIRMADFETLATQFLLRYLQ